MRVSAALVVPAPVQFASVCVPLYARAPLRQSRDEAVAALRELHSVRKAALAEWYLRLVDETTERWLASHFGAAAFVIDALPHDYLSEPPRDRDAATRSLLTIQSALSAGGAVRRALALELADPLRREVYAALTRFCSDVRTAMHSVLVAFGADGVAALGERGSAPPDVLALVRACQSDLAHFQEMQLLEDDVWRELTGHADATRKSQRSDIVPVTSLVFTKLRALESMFSTALEHHFSRQQPRPR